jgi:hypothetical protein
MQYWNWVLSADMRGRWITTNGYAEVELDGKNLHATLRYHAENGGIYHWIDATIDDDNVEAVVRSPDPETDEFRLGGAIFKGKLDDGIHPMMILLTDGTTVLSLAYGPCSHEGNYP